MPLSNRFFKTCGNLLLFVSCAIFTHSVSSHGNADHNDIANKIVFQDHESLDTPPTVQQRAVMTQLAETLGIGSNSEFQITPDAQTATIGRWEEPFEWPLVGVFNSLLSDGRVLSFDSAIYEGETTVADTQDFTRATVWDPLTGIHERMNSQTGHNLFCSGFASLPDGRLFLAAGNLPGNASIPQTHIFNPNSNSWLETQTMKHPRWYPGVTPLANGEMLITGGRIGESELRETDGTIRALSGLNQSYWRNSDYPWLQTAPNGEVAFLGPHPQLGYADTSGDGAWRETIERDNTYRSYGSYAMYDIGKVLITGGGFESASHTQSSTQIVSLLDQSSRPSGNMNYRRRQHDVTIMADGSVLASGGLSSNAGLVDLSSAVYASEIWNPVSGQWKTVASESSARLYHSSALLLPDGRILSTGGGVCGACTDAGYHMTDAQIYMPPYLFEKDGSGNLANRPTINGAPNELSFNQSFTVKSTQAGQITRATFIRMGSATHSQNSEQRYIPLSIQQSDSDTLVLQSPKNANIAPPGHYMLFLIDEAGVPSISKIIQLSLNDSLVDVDVLGLENLALGANAKQSSDYSNQSVAMKAIDGNINGNYNAGSVAHTRYQNNAWFELDLGALRDIDRIRLFNRTDCCSDRLTQFHILVSKQPFTSDSLAATIKQQGVSEYYFGKAVDVSTEVAINQVGRYVRIQAASSAFLSIAEIQVWGDRTVSFTPNELGTGQLPSGYGNLDFLTYNGNWIRDLTLPTEPENGATVSLNSQAQYNTYLNTRNSDYPLESLLIRENERYTFTYDSKTKLWLIGGSQVDRLTPASAGAVIPDYPKPVTFYNLYDGNWTGRISLPKSARSKDVIVVQTSATWNARINSIHLQYNRDIVLRQGENYAFEYDTSCSCWKWIQDESNRLTYNAGDLSNGEIPELRKPYARVNAWNGNYKRKIYLPIPSGKSAKIEVRSLAGWSFNVHGINNNADQFETIKYGQNITFFVNDTGQWKKQ